MTITGVTGVWAKRACMASAAFAASLAVAVSSVPVLSSTAQAQQISNVQSLSASAVAKSPDSSRLRALLGLSIASAANDSRAAATSKRAPVLITFRTMPQRLSVRSPSADRAAAAQNRQAQDAILARAFGTQARGAAGLKVKRHIYSPTFALAATASEINALAADPAVLRIQIDEPVPPALDASTALIDRPALAALGGTGSGRTVAVIDTGVQHTHESITAVRVVYEACYNTTYSVFGSTSWCPGGVDQVAGVAGAAADCNPAVASGCSHGTHVAGIAMGSNTSRQSGEPASGVAPLANLIAINAFSRFPATFGACGGSKDCVLSYTSDQITALEKVYDLRNTYAIDAVNMSLGGGSHTAHCNSDARAPIIALLRNAGIATVIAAGNDGSNGVTTNSNGSIRPQAVSAPGCIADAVTVSATTKSDGLASYSNWSTLSDIAAPGSAISAAYFGSGTAPQSSYASLSGTSMAAPHVAGAFAALRACAPAATVSQIETALKSTGLSLTAAGTALPRLRLGQAAQALANLGLGCGTPENAATSTTIVQSAPVSQAGQPVSFTASVSAVGRAAPTSGMVTFRNGPAVLGSASLSGGGTATLSFNSANPLTPAAYSITASYGGTAGYAASGASAAVSHAASAAATTTELVSTPGNSTAGETVLLSATVRNVASGSTLAPAGRIVFLQGTGQVGETNLVPGPAGTASATLDLAGLPVGEASLSARFLPSTGNFAPSTGFALHTVQAAPAAATTVEVLQSTEATELGGEVTFTAVVSGSDGIDPVSGTVTFFDGGAPIGTASLWGNFASFTTSSLPAGMRLISARFEGADGHDPSPVSPHVIHVVSSAALTATFVTLAQSAETSIVGEAVTVTATVEAEDGSPVTQGTVQFLDDGAPIGTARPVSDGRASLTVSDLALGERMLTAFYSGDGQFNASPVSDAIYHVVSSADAATTTSLAVSAGTVVAGGAITLTATVTASGALVPAGFVTFLDGVTVLDSVELDPTGIAVLETVAPDTGDMSLTAEYSGSDAHTLSVSQPITVRVTGKATTTILTAPASALAGTPIALVAAVSVSDGSGVTPAGSVTFSAGSTVLGTAALSGAGVAQFTVPARHRALIPGTVRFGARFDPANAATRASTAQAATSILLAAGDEVIIAGGTGSQWRGSAAAIGQGAQSGAVLAYLSRTSSTVPPAVLAQRVTADGRRAGPVIMVARPAIGASGVDVAGHPDGRFLVTWAARTAQGAAVFAQAFAASGQRSGPPITLSGRQGGHNGDPAIAALPGGGYVIVWETGDASGTGIALRRFGADGVAAGAATRVNTVTARDQANPDVAVLANGRIVVAFAHEAQPGLHRVMTRQFAADGTTLAPERALSTSLQRLQPRPALARLAQGGFALAHDMPRQPSAARPARIMLTRIGADGVPLGAVQAVSPALGGDQSAPAIVALAGGGLAVAHTAPDGAGSGVFVQMFAGDGGRFGATQRLHASVAGNQNEPALAPVAGGARSLSFWTTARAAPHGHDIATRVHAGPF
ncbi:MAG: Ig-like domain repeat protein [Rhizobiaceae bacterium]|nr:Ig-like domain repeat protein [Rhizobiaceae bacterium]